MQLAQVWEWADKSPYRSRLMGFLRWNSDVLEKLAVEMYARGLSVRDTDDALRDATGDPLLPRSAVSEWSETLWEDYDAFCQHGLLSCEVEYRCIDTMYEGLRQWGCSQKILYAWGICRNGSKIFLHLAQGSRESYRNCLDFIREMVRRGLHAPVLVITDGAPGLIRVVTEVWGRSLRQRCLAHKLRNTVDKLRRDAEMGIKRCVREVLYAPSLEMA